MCHRFIGCFSVRIQIDFVGPFRQAKFPGVAIHIPVFVKIDTVGADLDAPGGAIDVFLPLDARGGSEGQDGSIDGTAVSRGSRRATADGRSQTGKSGLNCYNNADSGG